MFFNDSSNTANVVYFVPNNLLIIMGSVFVFNTPMLKEKLQLVYNFPYFMRVFCLSRNDKNLWLSVITE